ncbi:hypothetical protein IVB38_18905 [Bradyrhizobium sp. 38]|uniref:hypothetical protein n=1 Tax=Bradyrhizobium sp. 197 TaxID=2782663 RepID=UPI001FFA7FE3|nr:hypothetical protein [Bradyrhizobium sp. 197]MCK1338033.1 hypothetical protein [Bradyrhizobium sp. 38]MCK1475605.1 hypothetical protein [Bradyrhizobium sp. 197]MCK1780327.1 hypothetical protein [Bradyrhizobium sp. 132]
MRAILGLDILVSLEIAPLPFSARFYFSLYFNDKVKSPSCDVQFVPNVRKAAIAGKRGKFLAMLIQIKLRRDASPRRSKHARVAKRASIATPDNAI